MLTIIEIYGYNPIGYPREIIYESFSLLFVCNLMVIFKYNEKQTFRVEFYRL